MSRKTLFVNVILPLALPRQYTYRVPLEMNERVMSGKRVVVQLGKSKLYSALISSVHETAPNGYEAKYIEYVLDEIPVVNELQLKLWDWISNYYLCSIGEVMTAALPGGLKLSSETKIVANLEFNKLELGNTLSDKEYLIVEALEVQQVLSIQDLEEIVGRKTVYPIVKSLIEKGAINIEEEIKEKFKPRIERYLSLNNIYQSDEAMRKLFESLEKRSFKQVEALMAFLKLIQELNKTSKQEVKKSVLVALLEGKSDAINGLIKKKVLIETARETGRLHGEDAGTDRKLLDENQTKALAEIKQNFTEKEVVLLHGVTSSGKTEVYIQLIQEAIDQGKQVLYLLPEIALTTQIITRLKRIFGKKVGVYHSKFSENERVEVWKNVLKNDDSSYKILLGARSSIFLPFSNLGLIIVDEEHDTSYKQFEPTPRYHARDTAMVLASLHRAKTLIGSATPSLESFFNASEKKYGLVNMHTRFGDVKMPEIVIADLKLANQKKEMKANFSPLLLEHIEKALINKEQIILFQNRRGFAPMLECTTCAWTPMCTQCDVSLTYHKGINLLRCHYCGYSIKPPTVCGACGNAEVKLKGFGTEKIEEDLSIFFPNARVSRMDMDTTRSKFAYHQIIQSFEDHQVDILVGTQMVTKGLDFDKVSVVGILNADSMLNFPDFRSFERAFQLMAQVSGRAGRKSKQGTVVIQTHNPDHQIIKQVMDNDYVGMYKTQLLERKTFNYPPFFRLIRITLKHKDIDLLNNAAADYAARLRQTFEKRVLGPEFPSVTKVRNYYLKHILLKLEKTVSMHKTKDVIQNLNDEFKKDSLFKSVIVLVDVDPF